MFSYERSVAFPEGHRNVVFARRGIRVLPNMPKMANNLEGHAPDTQMLYRYLRQYNGIVASHTSGTDMGTDWRETIHGRAAGGDLSGRPAELRDAGRAAK